MQPTLYKSLLATVTLLLVVVCAAMLFADRALEGWVRPWLERQAGAALDGRVSIGRLTLQHGTLTIDSLTVETAELSLSVPRIEAEFSLASLLQRRLGTMRIESPRLRVDTTQQADKKESSTGLPTRPPLAIDQLLLVNGEVRVRFGEQQVLLHGIDLQGALGARMSFKIVALVGEGQGNPLLLRGEARWNKTLALSLRELAWQDRPLLEKPVELALKTSGEARGGGALQLASFDDGKLSELLAAFGMESPLPDGFSFELNAPAVSVALVKEGLKVGLVVGSGQLHQADTSVAFKDVLVELLGKGEEWQGYGSLLGPAATVVSFEADYAAGQASGTVRVEVADPDRLLQELTGAEPVGLAGRLQVEAGFSWLDGGLEVTGRLRGQEREAADNDYKVDLAPLHGNLTWRQAVEQPGSFDLDLQAGERPLFKASGGLDLLNVSLAALDRTLLATLLNPELLPAALDAVADVTSSGQLRRDDQGRWHGDLQLAARRLGVAGLTASDLRLQGRLAYAGDELSFSSGTLAAGLAKGDELSGQLSGRFAASLAGQKYVVTLVKLALDNVEYLAADGLSGLGGGGVQLRGRIVGSLDGSGPQLDLTGSLKAGEVLAGALYADISALPGQFTLVGAFETDMTTMKLQKLQVDLPGLGMFAGSGRLLPDRVVLNGSLQLPDLVVGYGSHLGPMLVEMQPALKGLDLAGTLTVDCELDWSPAGAQVAGDVVVKGLAAVWPKLQLKIADGNGSLPFAVSTGATSAGAAWVAERTGELAFAALAAGPARLEEGRLTLAASPNRLAFGSPLVFELAGGRVALHDLAFGMGEAGPQVSLRIAVQEVDLETLTKKLELPGMRGVITADLGEIRYADQQLSSEGEAEIEVFSGRFRVRNMRYLEPFSPYPVFTADLDFKGLDLYQATNTFDFGEMNGVVDGYVHGLRLFGATPSAFEARLESRSEGKRNISVKALNNLSVLSQGGIQAALSRGVYRFIDFYRYRKIGIFCTLDNDNFVLKGTAVKDSSKTLIDGGLIPPRIDIVTSATNISFKEMMRRISRIKRAGK
jgi:hypothetical protein